MSVSSPLTLPSLWAQILARRGREVALWSPAGERRRSFQEIEAESRALAERLDSYPRGAVVALQMGNDERWPALLLALWRGGRIPLPLGRHLERADLRAALAVTGAAVVVTVEAGELRFTPTDLPAVALPAGTEFLKLTSGTTGQPRAVRFRIAQLVADAEQICETMGFGEEDLNFGVIPVSHSYGFSNLLLPLLVRGVPLALSDDRMPRAILRGLEQTAATVFPGMPVFYDKLVGLENMPPLPALRLCLSAGAPLSPAVAQKFTQTFGLKIHAFYGSSECGGISFDASAEPRYEEGFLGTPMAGVAITRAEGAASAGRISVRSAAVGEGYWPVEAPGSALEKGGFVPGDLVLWTERGLRLAGRASDVINIAGRKLNPAEVEEQMSGFPGLRQAVVFGVPSALRGEEPIACVSGVGLDGAALRRFCHERLSQWQMPRDFWIVDEIPTNDRGKINRRALAADYLARPAAPRP